MMREDLASEKLYPAALEIRILSGLIAKVARRSLEARLEAHGLPLGMLAYGVLRLLNLKEQTLGEMSHRMSLRPATLVPVIDALERQGLAQRQRDLHDRRRVRLSITEQGKATLAAMPPMDRDDALLQGLATLGDEQTRQLLFLMRSLVKQLPGGEDALSHVTARVHSHINSASHP